MIAPMRRAADAPPIMVSAAYLVALNALISNVQPLILGAMAKDFGLTDAHLGYVSAAFVSCNTLMTATGPFWVRRVDWRLCAFLGLFWAVLALGAGAIASQLVAVLGVFGFIGLMKGLVFVPSFATLGDATNPDRGYGVSIVLQGVTAAAVAAVLSMWVIPQFGVRGVFVTLALLTATGLPATLLLPGRREVSTDADEVALPVGAPLLSRAALAAILALLATMAMGGAVAGFWYYVERIGVARGVAPTVIGLTLSLTALSSILTSGLVAWLGGRVPSLTIALAGVAVMLLAFISLHLPPISGFIVANLLFALGWGFAVPGFWALLRRVDVTNRLFVAAPAANGVAASAIGLLSGVIISRWGYDGQIACSAILLCVSAALALVASRASPKPIPRDQPASAF
ncbi:MAG: MFS transporter [Proteobacteria bacterium]|nr:MFS transporter [Pseudomonadota bacterium]